MCTNSHLLRLASPPPSGKEKFSWGCAARFFKPLPYFKPKHLIFWYLFSHLPVSINKTSTNFYHFKTKILPHLSRSLSHPDGRGGKTHRSTLAGLTFEKHLVFTQGQLMELYMHSCPARLINTENVDWTGTSDLYLVINEFKKAIDKSIFLQMLSTRISLLRLLQESNPQRPGDNRQLSQVSVSNSFFFESFTYS